MTTPVRAAYTLCNRLGLHARAATSLAQLLAGFDAEVSLECDGQRARGSSVLELLMLCAQNGTPVQLVATGPQAQAAVEAAGQLILDRFGESD